MSGHPKPPNKPRRAKHPPQSGSERSTPQNPRGTSGNDPTNFANQNAPFPTPAPTPLHQQRRDQFNPVGDQHQEDNVQRAVPPRQRARNQSMPPNPDREPRRLIPQAPDFFPAHEMNPPPQMIPVYQIPPQMMHQPQMQQPQVVQYAVIPSPQMIHPMAQPPPQIPAPVVIPPPQLFQQPQVMPPHVVPDAAPQPPMLPQQLLEMKANMRELLADFADYVDDRYAKLSNALMRQQHEQLVAIQHWISQHQAANTLNRQPDEKSTKAASKAQEQRKDEKSDTQRAPPPQVLPDIKHQKTVRSFADVLRKNIPTTSDKQVQAAPQMGRCIPTQTVPVKFARKAENIPCLLTDTAIKADDDSKTTPIVQKESNTSHDDADNSFFPFEHESEETQEKNIESPPLDEQDKSSELQQDNLKDEEHKVETGADETATGPPAKPSKKMVRERELGELKKKIEKSDEDALAELDDYRSFINLLPSAIQAYVRNEHARRHTYLAFQHSDRIKFSDHQQTIVDYWTSGKLVGIHDQKCDPQLNIQHRFDGIIDSFRSSDVTSDMSLAFFMQSVLESTELVIEEDLIYFCDTNSTMHDLKVALECYCELILTYVGKEPVPVGLPCWIEDFDNVKVPFARDYLVNFMLYLNDQYSTRYELTDDSSLNKFDRGNRKAIAGWKRVNTEEVLEFHIEMLGNMAETDETRLFIQFYSFLKTVDSSILDFDVFRFAKNITATVNDPNPLLYHRKFFTLCFGYNPQ